MESKHLVSNEQLRAKLRIYASRQRNLNRRAKSDLLRPGLGEIRETLTELENLTEKDVTGLAGRIKRKKHADEEDMFRLCHAFLQNEENITAFTKITGALDVIIKEFISTTSDTQVLACEVLCNITLGNTVCCQKVAKSAGLYLITHLSGSHLPLIQTCLYTLTNILCEPKAAEIILKMEVLPKLIHLMKSKAHIDIYDDVITVLDVLLEKSQTLLQEGDRRVLQVEILATAPTNPIPTKLYFYALFSECSTESGFEDHLISPIISLCMKALQSEKDGCFDLSQIIYSVRILANLAVKSTFTIDVIFEECEKLHTLFTTLLNQLFNLRIEPLTNELLWFVACIYRTPNYVQNYMDDDNLFTNLVVPKKFIEVIA